MNHINSVYNPTKDDMLVVQERRRDLKHEFRKATGTVGPAGGRRTVVMKNWQPLVSLPEF